MDKRELEQLRYIKKEIEYTQRRVDMADELVEKWTTSTVVEGSLPFFPYTKHRIRVRGIDMAGYEQEAKKLRRKWRAKLRKLTKKIGEATEYIESIADSEMRMLLTLRYVEGLSWQNIAQKIGVQGDGSAERKRVERFLKHS